MSPLMSLLEKETKSLPNAHEHHDLKQPSDGDAAPDFAKSRTAFLGNRFVISLPSGRHVPDTTRADHHPEKKPAYRQKIKALSKSTNFW